MDINIIALQHNNSANRNDIMTTLQFDKTRCVCENVILHYDKASQAFQQNNMPNRQDIMSFDIIRLHKGKIAKCTNTTTWQTDRIT